MTIAPFKLFATVAFGAGLLAAMPAAAQTAELEASTFRAKDVPASATQPEAIRRAELRTDAPTPDDFVVQMGEAVEADENGGPDYAPDESSPAYRRAAPAAGNAKAAAEPVPAPLPADPEIQRWSYPPEPDTQPISPPPHRANAVRIPPSSWMKSNDELDIKESNGIKYATGGVGQQSRMQLEAVKGDFNLYVTNAATGGAFVGVTGLAILDSEGNVLVQSRVQPLFYAALPPGKYVVAAHAGGVSKQQNVVIPKASKKPVTRNISFSW